MKKGISLSDQIVLSTPILECSKKKKKCCKAFKKKSKYCKKCPKLGCTNFQVNAID
ncbi:MAG: hypothetical protein ACPG6V_00155 [Flavobacteriales bacterium]